MAVWLLDEDAIWFPNPFFGDEDGMVATGGDLSAERLIVAYEHGFFPWFACEINGEKQPINWYCPLNRFVIFPKDIHISHSMRHLMKNNKYEVTFNKDFEGVIRGCSEVNGRNQKDGAWLGEDMIEAYQRLHDMKRAMSVEVWEREEHGDGGRRLVGGLYGVMSGVVFCGESMFSRVPNASKLALIKLAETLSHIDGSLIDCQFETPHLKSMGGRYISYEVYLCHLHNKHKD